MHMGRLPREGAFGWPERPLPPVLARILPGTEATLGGVAVGVGWVYCFLSRREGDQRECWEPEAANPLKFSRPGSGWRFVRCGFGWGWFGCWCGPGSGICIGGWNRVSLKSCSGAIHDWDVVVVPGVSVV